MKVPERVPICVPELRPRAVDRQPTPASYETRSAWGQFGDSACRIDRSDPLSGCNAASGDGVSSRLRPVAESPACGSHVTKPIPCTAGRYEARFFDVFELDVAK